MNGFILYKKYNLFNICSLVRKLFKFSMCAFPGTKKKNLCQALRNWQKVFACWLVFISNCQTDKNALCQVKVRKMGIGQVEKLRWEPNKYACKVFAFLTTVCVPFYCCCAFIWLQYELKWQALYGRQENRAWGMANEVYVARTLREITQHPPTFLMCPEHFALQQLPHDIIYSHTHAAEK